jgi:hypothetical protein
MVKGMKAFFPMCCSGELMVPTQLPPEARLVRFTVISGEVFRVSLMAGRE